MEVERYSEAKHYKLMLEWLTKHEHYLPPKDEMPTVGFVVYYQDITPACMGFIRRVEGNFGQLDGLVTNPDLPGEIRSQAIDIAVQNIIAKAKLMGIKALTATSVDYSTLMRSLKHGFVPTPHSCIVLDLSNKAPERPHD